MDKLSFLEVIASIAVFISLLLALFLFTIKTKNKLENWLFATFLIINAIDTSGFFMYRFINNYMILHGPRISCHLLGMPVFYLYVNAVCYSDFKLKRKHLLHLIPFIMINLSLVPRFYLANDTARSYFYEHWAHSAEIYLHQILFELQFFFYIVAIFIILKKNRKIYLENYTNPNTLVHKWLFQITIVFLIVHSVVIAKNILRYTDYYELFLWMNVMTGIAVLFAACWFILKVLSHPELFRGIDSTLQLTKNFVDTPEIENITNETQSIQIEQLKKFMLEKEPFLEPLLTIQELADRVKMPVRDLSVLINHHINQHFFDFVNEYRVQKAMTFLKDPKKKELKVSEILYEVGFNSKSSFHTSFKKYTNLTPTEFRKY
jgi:AraC-like DNA-binding protein